MIRAVLFDADGVLQSSPTFLAMVAAFVHEERRSDFAKAIFDAEQPCLRGQGDFRENLSNVLAEWRLESSYDALMGVYHDIHIDQTVLRHVSALRSLGVACCIASNQQPYRANHMSTVLGYASHFDREFYSYALGVAKPEARYFQSILASLSVPVDQVLFIDDSIPNVLAASEAGIKSEHFPSNSGGERMAALLRQHGMQVA
jgi:putative hydrolase of the HAD superfamily